MKNQDNRPIIASGGPTDSRSINIPACGRLYQLTVIAEDPSSGDRAFQLGDSRQITIPAGTRYTLEGNSVPDMANQRISIGTGFHWMVIWDRGGRRQLKDGC